MTWLNWSLKLHIRLRIISILVPTHITHVYVQWMLYLFVWLYLIKCVSHTQFLLIKHKKIFECFNYFWKVFFFFTKILKISKTVLPYTSDLIAGQSSCIPLVVNLHRRFWRLTGESLSQSWTKLRKFSKILGFYNSRDSVWRLVCEWKIQSWGCTKNFAAPFATYLRVDILVSKNT